MKNKIRTIRKEMKLSQEELAQRWIVYLFLRRLNELFIKGAVLSMAFLSWNEIRAIQFSKEWENETSESTEAKSFLDGFFMSSVFLDVESQHLKSVGKADGEQGFVDLF